MVSIIVPSFNHCDDLLRPCIESILRYTDLSNVEVIVVANGCTDNTKSFLEGLHHSSIKLIWFDEPIGYTRATNEGIKASTGDYIILLNNDTVLLDQPRNQWLNILLEPFNNKKVGITGPMMVPHEKLKKEFIIFFCACVPRRIFSEIGTLDEIFSPGYGEDVDFCMRLQEAGYEMLQVCPSNAFSPDRFGTNRQMVGQFPLWHKGNETFRNWPGGEELLARNYGILISRYGPRERTGPKPVVYNCFSFNNELDLLEMRFMELYDVVDYFVISEGNKTFGGKPKPYYFKDNIKRFEKYMPKIVYITVDDWPDLSPWGMEHYQRDCCMKALTKCADTDVILITDADEIPNASVVTRYRPEDGIKDIAMDLYYYNLNTRWENKWKQSKIVPYGLLKNSNFWDIIYGPVHGTIPNGGKHLSYFGGVQTVIQKLEDGAHQELNTDVMKDPNRIKKVIETGTDVLGRPEEKFMKVNEKVQFNLGSGGEYKDGFINIDISHPKADVHFDLNKDWVFAQDGFADHVYSSNLFEHLTDKHHTMNELYRILKVGGTAELIIPSTDGRGAFQDPTHVTYWNINSWQYWCSNINPGLTAYNQACGFKGDFKCIDRGQATLPEDIIMMRVLLEKVAI